MAGRSLATSFEASTRNGARPAGPVSVSAQEAWLQYQYQLQGGVTAPVGTLLPPDCSIFIHEIGALFYNCEKVKNLLHPASRGWLDNVSIR
jgi:hypothetical protein